MQTSTAISGFVEADKCLVFALETLKRIEFNDFAKDEEGHLEYR